MTIEAILSQLELTFGRPSATVLFQNSMTFASQFNQMYTPESLLHCIEECQEVAVLGGALYSAAQIVGTTMFLFLQSGIFQRRGFETWENVAAKTWPALKLHVQQAYQRTLVAASLRNTSGTMGYTPNNNAFNAFVGDDESSVDMIMTQIAAATGTAATSGSTLANTYQASTVPTELAAAIQTIAANQHALYQHVILLTQQMAAMTYQQRAPALAQPLGNNFRVPQVPTYLGNQGAGRCSQRRGGGHGTTVMAKAATATKVEALYFFYFFLSNTMS